MQKNLSLQPFAIQRPTKIRWDLVLSTDSSMDQVFRSSSMAKLYRNLDDILKKNELSYTRKSLEKEKYLQWLEFYGRKVIEYGYRHLATDVWYDEKIAEGKTLEIIEISNSQQVVSAGIVLRQGLVKATLAFSANERLRISSISNSSLGAILNCLFFREMKTEGVALISGGRSRNAFGVSNTFGYLEYKLRLGYTPFADDTSPFEESVELNEDGVVMFFGFDKEHTYKLFGAKLIDSQFNFENIHPHIEKIEFIELTY